MPVDAAYLGVSDTFDGVIADFSEAFADVNARDHAAYLAAIESGRVSMPADGLTSGLRLGRARPTGSHA